MIQSAHYNGIDFSGSFARSSNLVDFDSQRVKNILQRDAAIKYLSFFTDIDDADIITATLTAKSEGADVVINSETPEAVTGGTLIMFQISANALNLSKGTYFEMNITYAGIDETLTESIFSEIYTVENFINSTKDLPLKITAKNNDSRHGFLEDEAFGFFEASGFNEDFFINSKVEYEYSYKRKMILSSENNIGRRISFKNLNNYNQILLKWLCNCELLYINGIQHELISDFTELLADPNSEIKDLQADFILSTQSFFKNGTTSTPKNVFTNEFFIK